MWQGQFNTLSLLTVQMQIQYHCGHKVQDSENITKHLKAIAAGMRRTNMQAQPDSCNTNKETGSWKNLSRMDCSNDIISAFKKRVVLFKHSLEHTAYQKLICSESVGHS